MNDAINNLTGRIDAIEIMLTTVIAALEMQGNIDGDKLTTYLYRLSNRELSATNDTPDSLAQRESMQQSLHHLADEVVRMREGRRFQAHKDNLG